LGVITARALNISDLYPRHWIVLTTKSIKVYEHEVDPEPKLLIPCKSIINLCYLSERLV